MNSELLLQEPEVNYDEHESVSDYNRKEEDLEITGQDVKEMDDETALIQDKKLKELIKTICDVHIDEKNYKLFVEEELTKQSATELHTFFLQNIEVFYNKYTRELDEIFLDFEAFICVAELLFWLRMCNEQTQEETVTMEYIVLTMERQTEIQQLYMKLDEEYKPILPKFEILLYIYDECLELAKKKNNIDISCSIILDCQFVMSKLLEVYQISHE